MSAILLLNGRLIDPANGIDAQKDLLLLGGKVAAVGESAAAAAPRGAQRLDLSGLVVCPGLIDPHVHLREPGQSAKETIGTGSAAAAKGGFTTVVCMPNTTPAIDTAGTVALIQDKIERQADINILIAGAITKGLAGEELAPIGSLKGAGVVAITDDGHCIQNNELMRRAMEYARMFDLPLFDHCQDNHLVGEGLMNEGYWNMVLGLPGWPASGEEIMVARNIHLAELTGTHVHCQNISTVGSVRLLRDAKTRGLPVSGEASPHYFALTDASVAGSDAFWAEDGQDLLNFIQRPFETPEWPSYDTALKMTPPLRSASDRAAVVEAIAEGTIDIIGSDHAPHCNYEKEVEFDIAPFGITGLETELSLSLGLLYHSGKMSLPALIERFTLGPCKLLHLAKGNLAPGQVADVTVFDPDVEWQFDRQQCLSKGKNTPFHGWPMRGKNAMTIVSGEVVWRDETRFQTERSNPEGPTGSP